MVKVFDTSILICIGDFYFNTDELISSKDPNHSFALVVVIVVVAKKKR